MLRNPLFLALPPNKQTGGKQNYIELAPVVQRVDNAIYWINHYPADKCWENKLDYPLDSDLSGG